MWRYHVKYRVAGLIPDPTLFMSKLRPIINDKLDLGSELVKRVPGHFWAISESVIPGGMTR
mgnify:CR=1 FL=1